MLNSAQRSVLKKHKEKKEKNHIKRKYAQFAQRDLKQEYHTKKDAQKDVVSSEEESQLVYNIQVDDCPEYFANNILVHNCAIAWQMRNYAIIIDKSNTYKQPEFDMDSEYYGK